MAASDLRDVLDAARKVSLHSTDKGDRLERLCKAVLTAHSGPNGSDRFEKVYLWKEWPGNDGPDTGIDLVARQTAAFGGGLCAIQCKFYGDDRQISTEAVDSFLAASGRAGFTHRILMHTGGSIQRHGANKLRNAHPPCEVFDIAEMGRWDVDWWAIAEANHVVTPGAPRKRSRAQGFFKGLRSDIKRYWGSWRRRWGAAGRWLRLWLIIEAALAVAIIAAVAASVLAIAVTMMVALLLFTVLSSGKNTGRRRR